MREISIRDRSWEEDVLFFTRFQVFQLSIGFSIFKFYLHIMSSLEDDNTISFD